jgi:3-oxoacyl-[acyl-carrier-protein] synthase II
MERNRLNPAITGTGLVTALGGNVAQTWQALLAGRSISDHAKIPGVESPGRCAKIALMAALEAIEGAKWPKKICGDDRTALIFATSKGQIEDWIAPLDRSTGCTSGAPLGGYGLSVTTTHLAERLAIAGPRLAMSAACATGLHGLIRAAMAMESGEIDRAIIVAAEASVHPLFVGSFKRLGVLAPEGHGCRPFDRNRKGFVMSEAAAAVCVEKSDERAIVHVDRFALGGEAESLTAGEPDGATLNRLLAHVLNDRDVDLIHSHGTGTIVHDPVELSAIEKSVGGARPILYSHKAALGHSLGAAGLVSIVLNCQCHREGIVPPNPRTTDPMEMNHVRFSSQALRQNIQRSLVIATGFGGPVAVVSLMRA